MCITNRSEIKDMQEIKTKRRRWRGCGNSLWGHSPPVAVNAIFEVEYSKPPDIHVKHVVVENILGDRRKGKRVMAILPSLKKLSAYNLML